MMRRTVALAAGLMMVSFAGSPTAATPVDVWVFNALNSFFPPFFLYPYGAPTAPIGTVGIDVATTTCLAGPGFAFSCVGAGSCDANPSGGPNVGVGCLGPVPFFNGFGAPTTFVECELIPPAGFLNVFPWFFLAQDVDSNGIIDTSLLGGDIVVGPSSFFFGTFGPSLTVPVFPGGFPSLLPGVDLHVILYDQFSILPVWPDVATVTCGAF